MFGKSLNWLIEGTFRSGRVGGAAGWVGGSISAVAVIGFNCLGWVGGLFLGVIG